MEKYYQRNLLDELIKWIERREIFIIKGPRQSGKTTLLKMLTSELTVKHGISPENIVFLNFDDYDVRNKFSADPIVFMKSYVPDGNQQRFFFLMDEFQYVRDGGQKLKLIYDTFENIKLIVTGSSSLELVDKTAKFLVGRMFSFNLYQMNFGEFMSVKSDRYARVHRDVSEKLKMFIYSGTEIGEYNDIFTDIFGKYFEEYVLFGGYPEIVKTGDIETKLIVLKNIQETYINRDILELLKITSVDKLRKLITITSNQIGNLVNYNNLANDALCYFKELQHYLSVLEETYVIRILKPFFKNKTTELKKNPKIYYVDTGMRNYVLRSFNDFEKRTDTGALVENFVLNQLATGYADLEVKFWRTTTKTEVDFVLELSGNELLPIEVKYSNFSEPAVPRGYRSFLDEYKPHRGIILTKNFWGVTRINSTILQFIPVWYI